MCKTLGCLVRPDDDDAKIQYSWCLVWLTVEAALSEDPGVIERLGQECQTWSALMWEYQWDLGTWMDS